LDSGSVLEISWNPDNTQFVCANSLGSISLIDVIGHRLESRLLDIVLLNRNTLMVKNVLTDVVEELQFPKDPIIGFDVSEEFLVILASNHCELLPPSLLFSFETYMQVTFIKLVN
jgi:hypothetical protein